MSKIDIQKDWPDWVIGEPIGGGGFGTVYEMHREVFGDVERKALKVIYIPKDNTEVEFLRAEGLSDETISTTFYGRMGDIAKEYKIMAKLRGNPNIVFCDDLKYTRQKNGIGWVIYIKMELLTPLMQALDQVQTERQILELGIQMCNALTACQSVNIIHRDIKPQNILISPNGTFKLGDFGISRTLEHTTKATAGIGTFQFMAPEVAKAQPYGPTVDIYSLGMVLYWLLNERRGPFLPLDPDALSYAQKDEAIVRRFSGEELPMPKNGSERLKLAVLKACSYDPKNRFQTPQEFMEELIRIQNGASTDETITCAPPQGHASTSRQETPRQTSGSEKTSFVSTRKPARENHIPSDGQSATDSSSNLKILCLVAVLAVLIIIIIGFMLFRPVHSQDNPSSNEEPSTISTMMPSEPSATIVDGGWEDNVLMQDLNAYGTPFGRVSSALWSYSVFGSEYLRQDITSVTFESTTENAPSDSWDVSAAQDGSVLAWTVPTTKGMHTSQGYGLYLAADGGINGKLACKDLFCGYVSLSEVNFNDSFHTEQAEDMSRMFFWCEALERLDLSEIRTDSATSFSEMFRLCGNLKDLNVSGFRTTNVRDMSGMFSRCDSLEQLDISGFETYQLTDVTMMFQGCPAASFVDLSNFDTSNVVSYGEFMDEGVLVDGSPWEDLFSSTVVNEASEKPHRIITGSWDKGNIKISIFSKDYAQIEIESEDFRDEEGRCNLDLYNSVEDLNLYRISVEYSDSQVDCNCSYLTDGSAANSYSPGEIPCSIKDNVITMDLYKHSALKWSLEDLEQICIEGTELDIPQGVAQVQFQHFEGPDEAKGGEATEKAIIVGLDAGGNPVWTHLTDVKTELYQTARLAEIGYVNDRYYYTDDDTLVILDAANGQIIKKVRDFGSGCTGFDVAPNGNLYLCCYWGPYFIEADKNGKVLYKIESFGDEYDWASGIRVEGDSAYVHFDLGPEPYSESGYTFCIDLNSHSFRQSNASMQAFEKPTSSTGSGLPSDIQPGDLVSFGTYEQDGNSSNGQEPIEWITLAREGNEVLLFSTKGLDSLAYSVSKNTADWESSSVRDWLNSTFFESAFSNAEQSNILKKTISADINVDYPYCDQGVDTTDCVFLLSDTEYTSYLQNSAVIDEEYCCGTPTTYTAGKNIDLYNHTYCWWWLRTSSKDNSTACRVTAYGVRDPGSTDINDNGGMIRPAIWVALN